MEVYEITGLHTGVQKSGVNYLSPEDSFETVLNGYIYRQVLQSRKGFNQFANGLKGRTAAPALTDSTRVMGIFEFFRSDGSKDLLVFTKKFLYKYNAGTNKFDLIPFNARIVGLNATFDYGIGLTDNSAYISGTGYPTKTGVDRFIFTSRGMTNTISLGNPCSGIWFYNGTDIGDFTNVADNPDFVAFAGGPITNPTFALSFGQRLNFFAPYINGIRQNQAILYSGIRDLSGTGDSFNAPGSGMLPADTAEDMSGISILGDMIAVGFNRSNWVIEKTRDVFNPYFFRKTPSILGNDAFFSSVSWNNEVKSLGKTGLITTDGRTSLRFDDKLPYFTVDELDQVNIGLTYGGFDRINGQFLFAFRSKYETLAAKTQDFVLSYNYEEQTWSIYDQRFSVFGQSDLGLALNWNQIDGTIDPSWDRWDTTEELWGDIGVTLGAQKTLAGDNNGYVYQLNQDYDDYFSLILGISNAAQAVISVDDAQFEIGDEVTFRDVVGMTTINGVKANVVAVDRTLTPNMVTVDYNSSNESPWVSGGSISKTIYFYVEMNPFNPYRKEGRKVYVSHVEFFVNSDADEVKVTITQDQMPGVSRETKFKPNNASVEPYQWLTVSVNQEANFLTFALEHNSASTQLRITSIRIHCDRGSLTTA